MRSRASILLLLPAVMACSLGEGEQKGPPQTRPNLVLISVDTLRADHLGTYGYERATSPTFDRLASEGIVFTNAVAPSTWTLPCPPRTGAATRKPCSTLCARHGAAPPFSSFTT